MEPGTCSTSEPITYECLVITPRMYHLSSTRQTRCVYYFQFDSAVCNSVSAYWHKLHLLTTLLLSRRQLSMIFSIHLPPPILSLSTLVSQR